MWREGSLSAQAAITKMSQTEQLTNKHEIHRPEAGNLRILVSVRLCFLLDGCLLPVTSQCRREEGVCGSLL